MKDFILKEQNASNVDFEYDVGEELELCRF